MMSPDSNARIPVWNIQTIASSYFSAALMPTETIIWSRWRSSMERGHCSL